MRAWPWIGPVVGLGVAASLGVGTVESPVAAQPQTVSKAPEHARPRLISEWSGLTPGTSTTIAVSFDIDPQWHLYWRGQSETGMPVRMQLSGPEGFEFGEVLWPAPHRHAPAEDILDHIHEGQLTLIVPVKVPATVAPGTSVDVRCSLEWLVCNESCIPGSAKLSLSLPVLAAGTSPVKTADAPRFDRTRATLPIAVPAGKVAASPVEATLVDGRLDVRVPGATSLEFYPEKESSNPTDLIKDGHAEGDRLSIGFQAAPGSKILASGVVAAARSGGQTTYYSLRVAEPGTEHPPEVR
jgi:thiol:disulfide interchange protein DsbD